MRPSSGEALSASEPSGWMVRSIDSASGRRLVGQRGRKLGETEEFADQPRRGRLQQGLPGGDVVGQSRDGLQFVGFQRRAGNLRLGGVLRGVEESADGDGGLLFQQQAQLAGELMLAGDPLFVGGGLEVENRLPANRRGGKAGDQRQQRLPLEGGKVGVLDRRRDGIEQGHGSILPAGHGGSIRMPKRDRPYEAEVDAVAAAAGQAAQAPAQAGSALAEADGVDSEAGALLLPG